MVLKLRLEISACFETTLADHGRVRSPTGSLPNIPETARVLKIACPGNRRDLVNAILGVVRAHARQSEGIEAVAVEAGIGPHVEEENNDAELEPLQEPQNTETHVHIGNPVGRTSPWRSVRDVFQFYRKPSRMVKCSFKGRPTLE